MLRERRGSGKDNSDGSPNYNNCIYSNVLHIASQLPRGIFLENSYNSM